MADESPPLTTAAAGRALGNLHRSTVIDYVEQGLLRLASRTAGGHRRIDPASVEELRRALAIDDREKRKAVLDELRQRNQRARAT